MKTTQSPSSIDFCEEGLREQIEILWRYQSLNEKLDPYFIRSHAMTIIQLSDEIAFTKLGAQRSERWN